MIAGSMGTQPMYTKRYGTLELENASNVDSYGMYVPNNQSFSENDIEKICDVITTALHQGENK